MPALAGLKVALLIANGFTENEFAEIQRTLLKQGAVLKTISTEKTLANGWMDNAWGHYFPVDQHIGDTLASDFDAMILVGGERSVQKLAQNPHTKRILKHFFDAEKPLAAINEAESLLALVEAEAGENIVTLKEADPAALTQALLSHFTGAEVLAAA